MISRCLPLARLHIHQAYSLTLSSTLFFSPSSCCSRKRKIISFGFPALARKNFCFIFRLKLCVSFWLAIAEEFLAIKRSIVGAFFPPPYSRIVRRKLNFNFKEQEANINGRLRCINNSDKEGKFHGKSNEANECLRSKG